MGASLMSVVRAVALWLRGIAVLGGCAFGLVWLDAVLESCFLRAGALWPSGWVSVVGCGVAVVCAFPRYLRVEPL